VKTRAELLCDGETQLHGSMLVTTPVRTAFDIGRRGSLVQAVARLDALARATDVKAGDVAELAARHPHTAVCANWRRPWTSSTAVPSRRRKPGCGYC